MATPRNVKGYLGLVGRGIAMGTADVIPGVSGGTIAFITGIYAELLETISSLKLDLLKIWRNDGIAAAWRAANLNFLLALLLGIGIAAAVIFGPLWWRPAVPCVAGDLTARSQARGPRSRSEPSSGSSTASTRQVRVSFSGVTMVRGPPRAQRRARAHPGQGLRRVAARQGPGHAAAPHS